LAKIPAQPTFTAKDEGYRVRNMTSNKPVKFQVSLSDFESAAITWNIADKNSTENQQQRIGLFGVFP